MNGFVNVLKPVGATASDVVVCVKHILHEKKVGHLGTLDPGASGVLPVAVGQGTKLFNLLTNKVKRYRAFFTFGKTTDTLDSYGAVIGKCEKIPTEQELLAVLPSFVGQIEQVPPEYSAISVGGVRAYKLARQGENISLNARKITIYEIDLLSQRSADTFVADIKCSGGTYIRSIARDLAAACGTVGYMSGLIRLSSGCFELSNAYTLEEIGNLGRSCVLDITYPLADLPVYDVESERYDDLDHGRIVRANFDEYRKIYCQGTFFGVGRASNGILKLEYYLKNALQE